MATTVVLVVVLTLGVSAAAVLRAVTVTPDLLAWADRRPPRG